MNKNYLSGIVGTALLLTLLCLIGILPVRANSIVYSYDSLNRLSRVGYANGSQIEFTYDAAGNRTGYLATAPGTTTSEIASLANGGNRELVITNTGGAGASYDWYRNGVKIGTTSEPRFPLASFSPVNAGNYRVIVRSAGGAVSIVELMVKLKGMSYETWLQYKEGSGATPADPGLARMSSAHNDGVQNILKYGFGKGPNEPANSVLPQPLWVGAGAEKRLAIKFRRIFEPLDITLKVEASGNLNDWRDVTAQLTSVGSPVIASDGLTEEVTLQSPPTISQPESADWKFLRIAVQDPTQASSVLLSDDFNDGVLDPAKWNAADTTVQEQDGYLKLLTNQTDAGGKVLSTEFPMPADGLTITRKARVHYANTFCIPSVRLNYWNGVNQEVTVFSIQYGNMAYSSGTEHTVYGTFLGLGIGNSHNNTLRQFTVEGPPVIWDSWFDEKITYDRQTGLVRYFRNGVQQMSGTAPLKDTGAPVFLKMDGWGWFTGHWQHCDDLVITSGTGP